MFFVSTNIAKKISINFFLKKVTHFYIANMFIFVIFIFTG